MQYSSFSLLKRFGYVPIVPSTPAKKVRSRPVKATQEEPVPPPQRAPGGIIIRSIDGVPLDFSSGSLLSPIGSSRGLHQQALAFGGGGGGGGVSRGVGAGDVVVAHHHSLSHALAHFSTHLPADAPGSLDACIFYRSPPWCAT